MANKHKEKTELENVPNQQLQQDSLTNERRLLALLFRKKQNLEMALAAGITHEYFINFRPAQIFGKMAIYYEEFKALLQGDTFESFLRQKCSTPEEVGQWMEEYHQIVRQIVDDNDFEFLRKTLCDNHVHRQAYTITHKYINLLLNAKSNQSELVAQFQQEVGDIGLPNDPTKIKDRRMSDALADAMIELRDRQLHPENYKGILTGYQTIDKSFIAGHMPGNYIVIAGTPNGGKTTLMFNLARKMALLKKRVCYVTVEADISYCAKRLLCMHAELNYNLINRGGKDVDGLSDTTLDRFAEIAQQMQADLSPYFHWVEIPYKTPWTIIENRLRQIRSFFEIDVLFVDYLNCIGREVSVVGRPDLELADVSSRIQNFGKASKILTITAQQMKTDKIRELHKKPSASKDFSPSIGDMSGTKEIESDADTIFAVWIDQETKNVMYVRSAKARFNQSQEKFSLGYDRDTGLVWDLPAKDEFGNVTTKLENNPSFVKAIATQPVATIADVATSSLWGDPVTPTP